MSTELTEEAFLVLVTLTLALELQKLWDS